MQIWTIWTKLEAFKCKFYNHSKGIWSIRMQILTIRMQIQTIATKFEAFECNVEPFERDS